jgi:GT2 family glycosyltransferase
MSGAVQLSVVVDGGTHAPAVGALLEALTGQTMSAGAFEVIVGTTGSASAMRAVVPDALRATTVVVTARDVASGLHAALHACTAPLVVMLDAGEVPAPGLLEAHLLAHVTAGREVVVQGPCRRLVRARAVPVDDTRSALSLLEATTPGLPRDAAALVDGASVGWRSVTLTNVSLPLEALRRVGGLDARTYPDGIGLDLDLALRLEESGVQALLCEAARSAPEGPLDVDAWLADLLTSGRALARLVSRRQDPSLAWFLAGRPLDHAFLRRAQRRCETSLFAVAHVADALRGQDLSALGVRDRAAVARGLEEAGTLAVLRGVLAETLGQDPLPLVTGGAPAGRLTTIIIPSFDQLELTKACLDHLRRAHDPDFPVQVVVVDNGSTDGSREWLETQPDVELLALPQNVGAPRARNMAMASCRGDLVVFMDNDAMVHAGWLSRLHWHAAVDPLAAFVGPVSDRAAHGQAITDVPSDPAELPAFAAAVAERCHRQVRLNAFLSSFCVMVRRDVLERLGGFDPRFSPWGFEDDDITLRAHLLGYHARVALDVFVRHVAYGGAKLAWHEALLRRNWSRFAAKWGLPASTPYRAHAEVAKAALAREWRDDELAIAWDAPEPSDEDALRPLSGGRPKAASGVPDVDAAAPTLPAAPALRSVVRRAPDLHLSVIVPTYARPDLVRNLLCSLDAQSLDPRAFEVILVDDGSPTPVAVDAAAHAYDVTLLRQENAGPGAARNLALEHCRAPLVLVLNDDAVPAPDDLEEHLRVHRSGPGNVAVLGTFDFVERARREPLTQVLEGSDLLFDHASMRHGRLHPWPYFWTCNISLSLAALQRVGGFDAARFREALVEDVELGYRLQRELDLRVLYWEKARCGHDHLLTVDGYFRRMVRLGVNLLRMHRKHGDPAILWRPAGWRLDEEQLLLLQERCEQALPAVLEGLETFRRLERERAGAPLAAAELSSLRRLARKMGNTFTEAGILLEAVGHDVAGVVRAGAPAGRLTSVVIVADEKPELLGRCLETVLDAREDAHPIEVVVVDDGTSGRTRDVVARFPDVRLVTSDRRLPQAAARNLGAGATAGEWIAFLEPAVAVAPGWLGRMLYHGEVDGRVACVGPLSNDASYGQELDDAPEDVALLPDVDAAVVRHQRRRAGYLLVLSGHCLLVRREALRALGGFDAGLSPSGYEDVDLTLRAHLAGWRNRVALDVFVHREPRAEGAAEAAWARLASKWGLPALRPGDLRTLVEHASAARPAVAPA